MMLQHDLILVSIFVVVVVNFVLLQFNTHLTVMLQTLFVAFNFHHCVEDGAPAAERCRTGDNHLVA